MSGDDGLASRAGAALVAAAALSAAALTLPLGLHPAVAAVAFVAAAAAILAAAGSGALARLGIGARSAAPALLAAAAVAAVLDRHVFVSSSAVAPDDVLAAATVVAALVPRVRRALGVLVALAVATYVVAALILVAAKPYHSDAVVAAHGAADLLLAGRHPYADFDMVDQLARFGLPETFATPLQDGTRLRAFQYPALAAIVPAPFLAAGLADVRVVYLLEVLAAFALVAAALPASWRALGVALCLADLAVLDQFVLAGVDPLWALLCAAAWLARRSRTSAVLLGLAVVSRQPAWLIAPFVLAWTWRAAGRREALIRAAVAAGVAAVVQLPFLATAPAAVVAGLTAPALLPLEAWGIGPAKLGSDGVLPLLPRPLYLAAAGGAYVLALWAFAAGRARGALTLPLLPLWLSWRALISYFAFLGPFVLLDRDDL